jgi:hypothetical protein
MPNGGEDVFVAMISDTAVAWQTDAQNRSKFFQFGYFYAGHQHGLI